MSANASRNHAESSGDGRCTFAGFTLDTRRQLLLRGTEPIRFRPRTYDVLAYLVAQAGRLVSKQELMAAVWGGIAVTDDSLVQCLMEIRRVLGDRHDVVKTVRGRGYLLDATVSWNDERASDEQDPAATLPPVADEAVPQAVVRLRVLAHRRVQGKGGVTSGSSCSRSTSASPGRFRSSPCAS